MLDTNIVLDLFVFRDERAAALRQVLEGGGACWLATAAMRDEFARVLDYEQIAPRLRFHGLQATAVLEAFDRHVQVAPAPLKATVTCADPDDQKFIDLAVARRAVLLSKDRAVLAMGKRLARLEVVARPVFAPDLLTA
ncbi:MAG TPA: PIN domain-containing protein [Ramlibacter sp.]|nr:PIN domain-containing protein [Ramlibacter sp.]